MISSERDADSDVAERQTAAGLSLLTVFTPTKCPPSTSSESRLVSETWVYCNKG